MDRLKLRVPRWGLSIVPPQQCRVSTAPPHIPTSPSPAACSASAIAPSHRPSAHTATAHQAARRTGRDAESVWPAAKCFDVDQFRLEKKSIHPEYASWHCDVCRALTCPRSCRPPRRTAGGGGPGCPRTCPNSHGRWPPGRWSPCRGRRWGWSRAGASASRGRR